MCYPRGVDHFDRFQPNWRFAQMLEQSDAATQQHRRQVDVYLVKQPGPEALLGNTRARYGDVLVPRGCFGLLNGAFRARPRPTSLRLSPRAGPPPLR